MKVTDEAWIAQRTAQQRPTWYLFKLGDKWPRCSLGTADLREARSLALRAYQAWLEDAGCDWRAACGNVSHHVSFKTVAEEWLATQKTDHAYKAGVVRKFLLPFFDAERSTTSMTMVTQALVDDYKVWRRDFWLTRQKAGNSTTVSDKQAENYREPSANTLNREYPTLRQILGYAAKKGYFEKQPIPVVEAENGSPNPRPAFLGDDFNVLMREVEKWIGEATDALTRQKR
ncbi:MAG: hypothetical protein WAW39_23730, partial [Prosthecobacter sp.]|uniref:hypothetical protein n=1 Tax=Prosthecobacter sp. TaxID=1965333 RepID=UPI003BB0B3ED